MVSKKENKEYRFNKNHINVSNVDSEWLMGETCKKYQQFEIKQQSRYKVILQFPIEKDNNSIQIETEVRNIMDNELKRFFANDML